MRQGVGRSRTRSALTQAAAALGRDGSRTRTQQRPLRSRAARITSSHDASRGTMDPELLPPLRGTDRHSLVYATTPARHAAAAVGLPTRATVARPLPHFG